MRHPPPPPGAIVLIQAGLRVTIACPYCHRQHDHLAKGYGKQRFAPPCGKNLTPDQRATGYAFHIEPK